MAIKPDFWAKGFKEAYERLAFRRQRDVALVIPESEESLNWVAAQMRVWHEAIEGVQLSLSEAPEEIRRKEDLTPWLVNNAGDLDTLLKVADDISRAILHKKLASYRDDIFSYMRDVLCDLDMLLTLYLAEASSGYLTRTEIDNRFQLAFHSLSLCLQRGLQMHNYHLRVLDGLSRRLRVPGDSVPKGSRQRPKWRRPLKWAAASTILVFLLLGDHIVPPLQLHYLRQGAKAVACAIGLLWFPTMFMRVSRSWRLPGYALWVMIGGALLLLWTYGVVRGMAITIFEIAQLRWLMSAEKEMEISRLISQFYRRQSLFFVFAVVVTGEPLWAIGLTLWLTFTSVATLSLRFFRPTFDALERLERRQPKEPVKDRIFYLSLAASATLLLSGIIGQLESALVLGLYAATAGMALTLVGILIAVQGVIPTMSMLADEGSVRIQAIQSIVRASQGLEGFLRAFFSILILALLGAVIGFLFPVEPHPVDLSWRHLMSPALGVFGEGVLGIPLAQRVSYSLLLTHTLVFSTYVCLVAFGLSALYYLFIAGNTLMIPAKMVLESTPALVESSRERESESKSGEVIRHVEAALTGSESLNGQVFSAIRVSEDDNDRFRVVVEVIQPFPEREGVVELAISILKATFSVSGIESTSVVVNTKDKLQGSIRAFALTVDRREYEWLKDGPKTFALEYKLRQLGATFSPIAFPDSQIL